MKVFKQSIKSLPTIYLILAIVVLAAALRFNHINQPYVDVFSWRQTSTAMMADNYYRTDWNIFFPEVSWGGEGPNYQGREFQTVSYISALLYTVFGQQDWIGRAVAASFGVWGVFALYQLVRRVWDEERALASALVMAVLPGSIFIDRSFLPDPAMVSLMVTSCWLTVAHFQTGSWTYLGLASVIFIWGALSKIPGLMVGIPLLYALFTILGRKRELRPSRLVPIAIAGALSLAPVVVYYLWAKYLASNYPPYHFAGSANWIWTQGLQRWLKEAYFLPELFDSARYWLWTWPIMVLAVIGVVIPYFDRRLPEQDSVQAPWMFHWWLVASGLYYFIGAYELIDNPWNLHIFNPAIAAFAGQAIVGIASFTSTVVPLLLPAQLTQKLNIRRMVAGLSVAILLVTILGFGHVRLKSMYSRTWGEEPYALGLMLQEASQPGDLVVTMSSDLGDPNIIYYSRRRGWTFPPADNDIDWSKLPEDDRDSIRMFEDLRARGADWLAIATEREKDFWVDHPQLVEHIESTCEHHSSNWAGVIYRVKPL